MSEEFRHLAPLPEAVVTVNRGRYLIAVIGIDDYGQWPKLHNAVSDAQGVEKLFVEKFGFLNPIPALLNGAATEDAIVELVQDKLPTVLNPDDNLLLFFAGHGHTRVSPVGDQQIETGYIIPVDARLDQWSDYIKLGSLLEDIGQLPARHILLILDACHSGFALGNVLELPRAAVRYEEDLIKRRSRKAITSARRDQPAGDSGPVDRHSLFTGTLVDGFNWGTVDLDGNGVVTSFELGLFLQQRVGQWSEAKQTPDFGSFFLDDRGEMVISLGDDNFDGVKARAFTALRYRAVTQFRQLLAQVIALRPQSPEALYLQYRLHLIDGQIEAANAMVWQLQALTLPSGAIPLSPQDLVDLTVQLPFWQTILALPATQLPVEITLLTKTKTDEFVVAPQADTAVEPVYQIENGAIARFAVKNHTDAPAHLYFIAIGGRGTLRISPLLENDNDRIDGLAAGAEGFGPPFAIKGPPGIYETRIFYAPMRVSPMLFPPTTAMRGASMPFQAAETVRMQRIYHEILAGDLPQTALEFPNTEVS